MFIRFYWSFIYIEECDSMDFNSISNIFLLFLATEIRCQEKSKGGLCYEVILAQPAIAVPPKPNAIPVIKSLSAEDIEKKLKEAEERRQVCYQLHLLFHLRDQPSNPFKFFGFYQFTVVGGQENR